MRVGTPQAHASKKPLSKITIMISLKFLIRKLAILAEEVILKNATANVCFAVLLEIFLPNLAALCAASFLPLHNVLRCLPLYALSQPDT